MKRIVRLAIFAGCSAGLSLGVHAQSTKASAAATIQAEPVATPTSEPAERPGKGRTYTAGRRGVIEQPVTETPTATAAPVCAVADTKGSPIGGIVVKGGKNPGGSCVTQTVTPAQPSKGHNEKGIK